MGGNFQIPFFAMLTIAALIFFWNAVAFGDDLVADNFDDLEAPDGLLAVPGFLVDLAVAVGGLAFDFASFAFVPWPWFQWLLIVFCNGTILMGLGLIVLELVPG